jgi:hypothetical protein
VGVNHPNTFFMEIITQARILRAHETIISIIEVYPQ